MKRVRFQVVVEIAGGEDALSYHGEYLNEATLSRLIQDVVYQHTNTHDADIKVHATKFGERDSDET